MSKKRKKAVPVHVPKPKDEVVWRQSSEEATLAGKPRYNGFACGHGAHGPAKYSRARTKQAWQRHMRQEGASRGSFLFARSYLSCVTCHSARHICSPKAFKCVHRARPAGRAFGLYASRVNPLCSRPV